MSKGKLKNSMEHGVMHSKNIKEKPKYMLFSVFTVLVYEYSGWGWIAVVTWFFVNVLLDFMLMHRRGEI